MHDLVFLEELESLRDLEQHVDFRVEAHRVFEGIFEVVQTFVGVVFHEQILGQVVAIHHVKRVVELGHIRILLVLDQSQNLFLVLDPVHIRLVSLLLFHSQLPLELLGTTIQGRVYRLIFLRHLVR